MNSTTTPASLLDFGGNLTTSGNVVSGTLFVITRAEDGSGRTSTPCFDLLRPVAFSGTVDSSGALKLVSAALANQIVTITGTVSADNELFNGSYTVAAADSSQPACGGGDSGSTRGNLMEPLHGIYTGTLTPSGGASLPATLQIDESTTPDAFASLHLTGTLSVPGWSCMTQGTIVTAGDGTIDPSTFIEGGFAILSVAGSSGGSTLDANVILAPSGDSVSFPLFVINDGPCAGMNGTASFSH